MKKFIFLFLILLILLVVNCSTQKFYLTEDGERLIPMKEGTSHFFVAGIGQTKEISAVQVCDERPVVAVETSYSFVDGLLGAITYGIYYPRSYTIYCGKKPKKE
jgi:hypothetical protein